MGRFIDALGTSFTKFQIGLGATGIALKVSAAKLRARNAADTADLPIVGSVVSASGDFLELNEDAAGAGADWKYTLSRPAAGMAANIALTFPPDQGTNGFALVTNGAGVSSWQAVSSGADQERSETTTVAFGAGATTAMYTHPANAVVLKVQVIVDTPFNGTPTLSVGIAGTTSKYMAATAVDLTAAAKTIFEVDPGEPAVGSTESIIATYAAGGASAGSARIVVSYVIPS